MAPNRDIVTNVSNTYSYTAYNAAGAVVGSGSNIPFATTMSYRDLLSAVSVKTTNFRSLKKYQLPWHPYSKHTILLRDSLAVFKQTAYNLPLGGPRTVYTYSCNAKSLGLDVRREAWPATEAEDPYSRAFSRLVKQIGDGNAQLGIAAAEMNKTAAMVAQTATKLVKALRALKSCRFSEFTNALGVTASRRYTDRFYTGMRKHFGRKGEGFRYDRKYPLTKEQQQSRFTDFLASTWLAYSYGWKPLIKDAFDTASASAKLCQDTSWHWSTYRGSAQTELKSSSDTISSQLRFVRQTESRKRTQIVVQYNIPGGFLPSTVAFGLTNPYSIAYELVPFSFVADWFYPFGQYLSALSAFDGLNFLKGSVSVDHKYTNDVAVKAGPNYMSGGVLYIVEQAAQKAFVEEFGFSRTVLSTFPSVPMPALKDPRSFEHALSAIALLKSLFLKSGTLRI